ncbi:M20 family metallo-hydrolase [Bordetella genomosp. 13]|uniref:M20 family metallo-hydrolase n=1 Tax=Bordetella genomosp. 13 TaxID=463040 RepID=UPI00119F71BD|nr:M20 family metallo-hydrolase [Bordetella genomosp. 13]
MNASIHEEGIVVQGGGQDLPARVARAVDAERLERRQRGLAGFGGVASGGVARQALTAEELAARRWLVADFAARPGYGVGVDVAGNVHLRRDGAEPGLTPVMTGSHIDTQPLGGWLDGAFGVVAGLEVFDALDACGLRTRRPIDVVMWTNEEGSRYAPGLMGSHSYAAPHRLDGFLDVKDGGGLRFGDACEAAVADLRAAAREHGWAWMDVELGRPVHAYLEAHIEQGPVLEAEGLQVGCVDAIQGVRWFRVTITGRSAHAGTTPLAARDDAQAKAVHLAHALLDHARTCGDERLRLTIGRWECAPGSINTVADRVVFTVDMRHPEAGVLDTVQALLARALPAGGRIDVLQNQPTVRFDAGLTALTREACAALALRHRAMPSGAFHDAMPMAGFCPTAMLFAPSIAGVSHHPGEDTPIDDLAACTRALAWCLARLAEPAVAP